MHPLLLKKRQPETMHQSKRSSDQMHPIRTFSCYVGLLEPDPRRLEGRGGFLVQLLAVELATDAVGDLRAKAQQWKSST